MTILFLLNATRLIGYAGHDQRRVPERADRQLTEEDR